MASEGSSVSKYFKNNESISDDLFPSELERATSRTEKLEVKDAVSIEPQVSRLFTDNTNGQTTFFDLIGSNPNIANNRIISQLDVTPNDDGYNPRVVKGSESDRRRDAWIPSENTLKCLIECATRSTTATPHVPAQMLTMPGISLDEYLTDSVREAIIDCIGEAEASQRSVLTDKDVTQDERGLKELVQAGCYRAGINLTSRLLAIYGQGSNQAGKPTKHSHHSLQLWFTRIALLVKTKAFGEAQKEAEPFGQLDKPDIFYQFYPEMYDNRSGSIASFSFRLLLAELGMHCGQPHNSLTKLYAMKATIAQMLHNLKQGLCEDGSPMEICDEDRKESEKLWQGRETRVLHSIVNCALALQDYDLAMITMRNLVDRPNTPKAALLSALGRLHLQLGDITGAESCFEQSCAIEGHSVELRNTIDRGLLAIAQNNYSNAYAAFQQASVTDPSNIMVLNNMAVCLLYQGRLKQAIAVFESAIAQNPAHALHESLLLNLCTLYDLESSKGRMKKFALLKQISKYQADAPTTILEKLYG